jgi:hypothetical protein
MFIAHFILNGKTQKEESAKKTRERERGGDRKLKKEGEMGRVCSMQEETRSALTF